jgi:hypothetical protein
MVVLVGAFAAFMRIGKSIAKRAVTNNEVRIKSLQAFTNPETERELPLLLVAL